MDPTRIFAIISWVLLPTVMLGGYSLLSLLVRANPWLTPKRLATFRAGHAHAGALLVLSLLYYTYLAQTSFSSTVKLIACFVYVLGALAQSGGFFIDMLVEKRGRLSFGYLMTTLGALLLASSILLLAYGLAVLPVSN
ncbi:hypothetical protein KSC_034710 [Ktedonobacter sp. SOSP1-52]|uniref:hypothetical protein n=1 Tax=Ktedonobacter sp. SOSP1-52 TaxID=2778366 RepID=UPI001916581F|nr:hypothetical protein [Ktedonobacter sp. SOSP1-52]GHO64579.1 hypothetical protein KSC_034710 [Ktedonobacter sp. SOSP1-52]